MSETLANMEKLGGIDYSTEEQWTGKYWIDGKKIYQKTVDYGALPNATIKDVSVGYTGNQIKPIDIKGIATRSSDNMTISLPRSNPTAANSISADVIDYSGNLYIRITDAGDYSGFNGYITLEYTKTTD